MSGLTNVGAGVGATVLGVRILGEQPAVSPLTKGVSKVASGLLPMTGIALAVYIAVAVGFIATGFVMRRLGSK